MYLIIAGIIIIIIPYLPKLRLIGLMKNGERCEGVIHKLDYKNPDSEEATAKDKITVRFITKGREEITADLDTTFIVVLDLLREGDKVPVIYNPANPRHFSLEKLPSDIIVKAGCIVVGLLCVTFGLGSANPV